MKMTKMGNITLLNNSLLTLLGVQNETVALLQWHLQQQIHQGSIIEGESAIRRTYNFYVFAKP